VRGGRAAGRPLGRDGRPERVDVGVGAPLRREPCDSRLEEQARLEPLEHALEPDVRDEEPAVDLEDDEPVAREATQRLADRPPGDAEPVGELGLADPGPGLQASVDDPRAQLVVGELHDGADAEGRRLAHGRCSGVGE
jgi:hypothetical protein